MSNHQETILSVRGMNCSSCSRHVESALYELDGIRSVAVELKAGKVRVQHDDRSTIEELIRTLALAGYEATL